MKLNKSDFGIISSSSMLLEKYGNAQSDVTNDGFNIVGQVDCLLLNDSVESMTKTFSLSMLGHSHWFSFYKPKAILATGDRFDMLPAVMSARLMNIPVLHIQGGEKSGSIDDTIRNMITMCAREHYAATEFSKHRIQQMTNSDRVFFTGCPAVEFVSSIDVGKQLDVTGFKKKYKHDINIKPEDDYILIVVHPVTTDHDSLSMLTIIKAVCDFKMKKVLFYPNADAFNSEISNTIRQHEDKFILIKHAPIEDFVKFMAHAKCMIGNSSAGIREAASFGTPVVNIGTRQIHRERNKNTIDVDCNENLIKIAISESVKNGKYKVENVYHKFESSKEIAGLITNFLAEN